MGNVRYSLLEQLITKIKQNIAIHIQSFVKKHNNKYNLNNFLTHAFSCSHLSVAEFEAPPPSTIASIKLDSLVNLDSINLYDKPLNFMSTPIPTPMQLLMVIQYQKK
ncbi:unnamed protein product [Rhizopus stolonifer]